MSVGYFEIDQVVRFRGKNALIENAITKDDKPYYLLRMSDRIEVEDGIETEYFGDDYAVAFGDELKADGNR